jgi:peptidoglycan/xylan/chitin deacetylase (PgdA/CDA1 family)
MSLDLQLTFDDGPSEWTYPLLDVLSTHHVKVTFFVVGQHILGHENLLRRMVAHGHTIGNHTLSHRKLSELDIVGQRVELEACSWLVWQACGVRPTVWRAPYFDATVEAVTQAETLGMRHVGADIDPHDWEHDDHGGIVERVLRHAEPGAVVCLHDGIPPGGGNGTGSRAATVIAVRLLLETKG